MAKGRGREAREQKAVLRKQSKERRMDADSSQPCEKGQKEERNQGPVG